MEHCLPHQTKLLSPYCFVVVAACIIIVTNNVHDKKKIVRRNIFRSTEKEREKKTTTLYSLSPATLYKLIALQIQLQYFFSQWIIINIERRQEERASKEKNYYNYNWKQVEKFANDFTIELAIKNIHVHGVRDDDCSGQSGNMTTLERFFFLELL